MEIWKDIISYEGLYQVSNLGRVKTLSRIVHHSEGYTKALKEKVLKGGVYPNGYEFVCLRKDRVNKNIMIHRLVAKMFIPNVNNLKVVNHINGIKSDNRSCNLEWCTQSYNLKHAVKIGLIKNQCRIMRKVTVKYNEKIIIFETMKECAEYFGYKKGWLHNRIRKHGCNFNYKNYEIEVHERGTA